MTTRSTSSASTSSAVSGAPSRLASWRPRQHRLASTDCSTAAVLTSCGGRQSEPSPCSFYSLIMSLIIGFILHKTVGFRVSEEDERTGVDEVEHAETGYDLGTLGAGIRGMSYGGSAPSQVEEDSKNGQEVTA